MSKKLVAIKDRFPNVKEFIRNPNPPELYAYAIKYEKRDTAISDKGAIMVRSGEKTGRSPTDKRVVRKTETEKDIWWGDVNIALDYHTFQINKARAIDYMNTRSRLYIIDGYAGWDEEFQIKVRIICTRPYHALFMSNMLIRPTNAQLEGFGEPDYTVYNAGEFPANKFTSHMTSTTSVDVDFEAGEFVILGTEYAGEMKKGIFTIMNYIMPKKGILSMHCSANEADNGDLSLFFGLSGTGKTTLSADPHRRLIGDDEHCWSDNGVFNIEGGCYAKCIDLTEAKEPEIFQAIRFGTVLENVIYDPVTHEVNYEDGSITENTRASYPIEFIDNAKIPCVGGHPNNIIFLTCDAFGVLPPVSKLTPEQAMYHFISGYTAKVAGTEMGVTEPEATFSACFGAAFMVWHPSKYAELLAKRINDNNANVWLVNTGWSGGGYGVGERMELSYTRSIIDAIHNGSLKNSATQIDAYFGFKVPQECQNVPSEILNPRNTWENKKSYDDSAKHLAFLYRENFKKYEEGCSQDIISAGPTG